MSAGCDRADKPLRLGLLVSPALQETENPRVHYTTLGKTHIVTAPWDQPAFEIPDQPAGPIECLRRVVNDLEIADEQEDRHGQAAELVIG